MPQPLSSQVEFATPQAIRTKRVERLFYVGMSVALLLTVFAGFARTYFLKAYFGTPALPALVHFHGIVFTSWFVLFFVQTSLVAAGRIDIHRRLGIAGAGVAVLLVGLGTVTAIGGAAAGRSPPGGPPPLVFLAIPLEAMVVFSALVGAGLYYRRRPDVHKRLMLFATIAICAAAVSRLPFAFLKAGPPAFFGLTDLFLVPCVAIDFMTRGRIHPVTVWGSLFIIASQVLCVIVGGTQTWLEFAGWLTHFSA